MALTKENESGNTRTFLTFHLDNEQFAAPVDYVMNIMELTPVTKVPNSPPHLKGVINLRGNILPVVDTRVRFELPEAQRNKETAIIVFEITEEHEKIQVGAIVDSVHEVIQAKENQIKPPLTVGTKFKSDFITAVIEHKDTFINLLDMEKLLASEIEEQEHEQAAEEAPPEEE